MIHLRNVNFNAKFVTVYFCRRNLPDILTSNGFQDRLVGRCSLMQFTFACYVTTRIRFGWNTVIFNRLSLRSKVRRLSNAFAIKYVTRICGAHPGCAMSGLDWMQRYVCYSILLQKKYTGYSYIKWFSGSVSWTVFFNAIHVRTQSCHWIRSVSNRVKS